MIEMVKFVITPPTQQTSLEFGLKHNRKCFECAGKNMHADKWDSYKETSISGLWSDPFKHSRDPREETSPFNPGFINL